MAMIINSGEVLDDFITSVTSQGTETIYTYEHIGASLSFKLVDTDNIQILTGVDDIFIRDFKKALVLGLDEELLDGVYIMREYNFLMAAIKDAVRQLHCDGEETRRCIVQFPPEHCFQSIQFLVRHNLLTTVCTMRSCNAVVNLRHDIAILSILSDFFGVVLYHSGNVRVCSQHTIHLMIGSLHTFKEA